MIETGVRFDNIHSFHDLGLILAPFVTPPAEPKTNFIDIPGGDGSLDFSEAGGGMKYHDRELTFTFTVEPSETMTFDEKQTQVSNALNGRRFDKITLDKDSDYYFSGRCMVNQHLADKNLNQIVVKAKVKPFKFRQSKTVFSFNLTSERKTVVLQNGRKPAVPTITCEGNSTVVFGGIAYTLEPGTYKILDICLVEGNNTFGLSGNGVIKFEYQEGDL